MSDRRKQQSKLAERLILEAAARVFSRRGYVGSTIEEIAREADYSPASLYSYFKGKEELFSELFAYLTDRLIDAVTRPLPDGIPFRARLAWMLSESAKSASKSKHLLVATFQQRIVIATELSERLAEVQMRNHQRYFAVLEELMNRGIEEGALKPGDPMDYAWSFFGIIQSAYVRWIIQDRELDIEKLSHQALDIFFDGAGS